jgi:hypothetical protein
MTTRRAAPEEAPESNPLFDAPPHNGRPTSIAAAASVADRVATQRLAVLGVIAATPHGLTREEIADALHLGGDTVRPRVWELMGNNGHGAQIRESGERRKTRSGRNAEVLVAL